MSDHDSLLRRLSLEEARLQLSHFDATLAWDLASSLRERALAQGLAIAFDVSFAGITWAYVSMEGASPDNAEWIRRKKNVVLRYQKSSYAVLTEMEKRGATLESRGCPIADYVAAGGCFPLRMRGASGVLGTLTVSGLSGREDHELAVSVLAERLGVELST
ncbi:MAG TPA: heme-degrading domain-containing protein [Polyangiaceae bacterium]|nr:heme-degrading domain-containing protein [Polyangiaceae bacterium]